MFHSCRTGDWEVVVDCIAGIDEICRKRREINSYQKVNYHQDVPAIMVIVDAGWSKCTHKHSHNALSCVGVIFGKETQKLLNIHRSTK